MTTAPEHRQKQVNGVGFYIKPTDRVRKTVQNYNLISVEKFSNHCGSEKNAGFRTILTKVYSLLFITSVDQKKLQRFLTSESLPIFGNHSNY